MSRAFVLSLALLAATSSISLACDRNGANAPDGSERADVTSSDFEKLRADYRQQKQADLALLDKSIKGLEAKESAASAKAKADLHGTVSSLKGARDAFVVDLHTIESATASTWDSTKARLDKEWGDLTAVADKAATSAASPDAAQYKPGEMTCAEFIALREVERPKIVYWTEGFNKSGKPVDSVLDFARTDQLVPILVAECTKAPNEWLAKVVQLHASVASKTVAPTTAPKTMTCEQFVAIEDVAKPKLVYWAAGFNSTKDGGTNSAVVDIAETDRLVPVITTECKETPTLTLWQKIKKHF